MMFVTRQVLVKNPHLLLLSVSLPTPPPEKVFLGGIPHGAIESVKAAYGMVVQILDPRRDGFNLTVKLNFSKLPPDEGNRNALFVKVASVREVVLAAPLQVVLKHLSSRTLAPDGDKLVALVHRPKESFSLAPRAEKVTMIFPMRFKDSMDTVLAISFLQEFVEATRAASLNTEPSCLWSPSPPEELNDAPADSLSVILYLLPQCSEGFMHSWMRRRMESLIQALDHAKPDSAEAKKSPQGRSFKRLSLKRMHCTWVN